MAHAKHHHAAPRYDEWWNPAYDLNMDAGRASERVGNHYWRMRDLMGQKI